MNNDWLKELKVGDKVLVNSNMGDYVDEIKRKTATLLVTTQEQKFKLDTGSQTPSQKWVSRYLSPLTCEVAEQLAFERIKENLSHVDWDKEDKELVLKIHELITNKKG
jgi:hypothetical protein